MTTREIQSVVREAARSGGKVAARGFGTWAGPVPDGAVVVDTRGLAGIVEYDPADLTVTVEAGCGVDALDRTLAEHGQWLPVDVARPEATTVGGMIAVGLVGPLRRAFGTLRDQLIGIEWIGGAGQILRSGGRVVKNVAGYDLMKLHVGARGRLGIVTRATFRVRPRPPAASAARNAGASSVAFLSATAHPDPRVEQIREGIRRVFDPNDVFGGMR